MGNIHISEMIFGLSIDCSIFFSCNLDIVISFYFFNSSKNITPRFVIINF